MWYPLIFIGATLAILVVVIRRAFWLGPAVSDHGVKIDLDVGEDKESEIALARQRAETLFEEGKYLAADRWYKEVIRLNEHDDRAWARLGVIAVAQKRYDAGTRALGRAVKLNPKISSRHYNLALAYFLLNDKESAKEAIDTALKLSPDKSNYLELKDKIIRG